MVVNSMAVSPKLLIKRHEKMTQDVWYNDVRIRFKSDVNVIRCHEHI